MEREMLKYGVYAKGVELLCFKHAVIRKFTCYRFLFFQAN